MKFSFIVNYWVSKEVDKEGNITLWFQEENLNMIELTFRNNWTSKKWFRDMMKELNKEVKA